jgi:hypothetical protein
MLVTSTGTRLPLAERLPSLTLSAIVGLVAAMAVLLSAPVRRRSRTSYAWLMAITAGYTLLTANAGAANPSQPTADLGIEAGRDVIPRTTRYRRLGPLPGRNPGHRRTAGSAIDAPLAPLSSDRTRLHCGQRSRQTCRRGRLPVSQCRTYSVRVRCAEHTKIALSSRHARCGAGARPVCAGGSDTRPAGVVRLWSPGRPGSAKTRVVDAVVERLRGDLVVTQAHAVAASTGCRTAYSSCCSSGTTRRSPHYRTGNRKRSRSRSRFGRATQCGRWRTGMCLLLVAACDNDQPSDDNIISTIVLGPPSG